MLTMAPSFSSVSSVLIRYCCYQVLLLVTLCDPAWLSSAQVSCLLAQLLRKPELNGLGGDDDVLGLNLAKAAQSRHDLADDRRGCRCPGRDPDRRGAGQPGQLDVLRTVDQVGRGPGALGGLDEALRVGGVD